MRSLLGAACVFLSLCAPQASWTAPWVFPGDFRQRLRISDLVVSGVIEGTTSKGVRTLDGTELDAHIAGMRVDRVFQGDFARRIEFTWFTLHIPKTGMMYSGPPIADFRPGERYLVFLKHDVPGWVVAMPLYALEFALAPGSSAGSFRDLSQATLQQRYEGMAEELENAAIRQPAPPPGMTGEAPTYFSAVFDLIGGCAEPFYRRFSSSPSPELRDVAVGWLEVIRSHHMKCQGGAHGLGR